MTDPKADEEKKILAVSNIKAIKGYFEAGQYGRPVTLPELKALSQPQRAELGEMCLTALAKKWD